MPFDQENCLLEIESIGLYLNVHASFLDKKCEYLWQGYWYFFHHSISNFLNAIECWIKILCNHNSDSYRELVIGLFLAQDSFIDSHLKRFSWEFGGCEQWARRKVPSGHFEDGIVRMEPKYVGRSKGTNEEQNFVENPRS